VPRAAATDAERLGGATSQRISPFFRVFGYVLIALPPHTRVPRTSSESVPDARQIRVPSRVPRHNFATFSLIVHEQSFIGRMSGPSPRLLDENPRKDFRSVKIPRRRVSGARLGIVIGITWRRMLRALVVLPMLD